MTELLSKPQRNLDVTSRKPWLEPQVVLERSLEARAQGEPPSSAPQPYGFGPLVTGTVGP